MNSVTNQTTKTSPNSGRCAMAEQKQYKAGDTFVVPVTFQLLKTLGHEDNVYYLCAPVDDAQRSVCLKDPFFLMCLEPGEDKPTIPAAVIERAYDFVHLGADEADDDVADGDEEPGE